MTLTAYSNSGFTAQVGQPMTVYINPESYSVDYTIDYNETTAQGSPGGSPQYNRTLAPSASFQLIFDGTGVVPASVPATSSSAGIVPQINAFLALAFTYDGKIHSPNFLLIAWGTLVFQCRLKTLKLTYTLFMPDGTPLRAKADLNLIGYQNPQQIAKEANKSSPDLSHLVTVKGGDTLPLLCYTIYGSSAYYTQVAAINGMSGFRTLIPGEVLLFPPLAEPTR